MKQVKIKDVMVGQRFKLNNTWFTMLDKATSRCISDIVGECRFITYDINEVTDYVGVYKNQAPNDYNGSIVENTIKNYTTKNFKIMSKLCERRKVDLWDTVNNKEYGVYDCYFSAPSLVEWEMYRENIPNTDKEWWLCTPLLSRKICDNIEDDLPFLRKVWAVDKRGVPVIRDVDNICGVRFCAHFRLNTVCEIDENDKDCFLTGGLCTEDKCRFFKSGKCCANDVIQELVKKFNLQGECL